LELVEIWRNRVELALNYSKLKRHQQDLADLKVLVFNQTEDFYCIYQMNLQLISVMKQNITYKGILIRFIRAIFLVSSSYCLTLLILPFHMKKNSIVAG
jgi:hypothetical protein